MNIKNHEKSESKVAGELLEYKKVQRYAAQILYIIYVIAIIIIIGGMVWTIADLIMRYGKTTLFLQLSLGYQVAIIGIILAVFFFLVIFFYGLFKKGIIVILKILFKRKTYPTRFRNKWSIRIMIAALMLSVFAIIIGGVFSLVFDLILGATDGTFSLSALLEIYSGGLIALFIGIFVFLINSLSFLLIYLWYNGYYAILKLVADLED